VQTGIANVKQSLVEVGSALRFHEPKTAGGRRSVALTPVCVIALKEHRERQDATRELLGSAWRDNDRVFTVGDGGPRAPRTFIRRYHELVKRADVPMYPCHGVRHAHATALVRQGVHLQIVSERLGHRGNQITADTYAHVTPEIQRDAIKDVDAALVSRPQRALVS